MEKVNFIGNLEIFTKGILLGIKEKDMEKCFGMMEVITKVNGVKEFKMEMVHYFCHLIKPIQGYLRTMYSQLKNQKPDQ